MIPYILYMFMTLNSELTNNDTCQSDCVEDNPVTRLAGGRGDTPPDDDDSDKKLKDD